MFYYILKGLNDKFLSFYVWIKKFQKYVLASYNISTQ